MRNLLAISGFLFCLLIAFGAGKDWHLHNYRPPLIFLDTHKEPLSKEDIKMIETILHGRGLIANVDLDWRDGKLYLGEVEGYENGSISHFEAIGLTMGRQIDNTLYGDDSKLRVMGTFNPIGAIVYSAPSKVGPFNCLGDRHACN